jgi:3-oxoadipate CoA-transferase, beta subunit
VKTPIPALLAHVTPRSTAQIAQRMVQDIPDGAYVNLGIGQPMTLANHLPPDKEIILQSENGVLGMGPLATGADIDPELVNAGKQNITLLKGGSIFHHGDSFAMIRGGHIDICVLGAFQVSVKGDLANWRTLDRDAIPAVGGAMDLAYGAKQVFVMMEHLTKSGQSKLVPECTYPLTGVAVVSRIYTDLATLQVTPAGLQVIDIVDGLGFEALQTLSQMPLLPLLPLPPSLPL